MKYAFSFLAVIAMVLIAWLGSQIPGMPYLFGVALPYLALLIFLGGFIYRVVHWAKSPVPFPIQTTCGQGKSLDFIKHNRLEAPNTTAEVVARMFLEIVTFRSLFRNTKSEIHTGPHITYESSKWLWLFALLFHYSFLAIVVRHMRLFLDPVPVWITWIEFVDGIFQVGAPGWYISDVTLVLGCVLLFGRRLVNRHTRVISLMNDYFPLVLIFAIAVSGILMRYFLRTDIDIVNIKQLTVGLVTFSPTIGAEIGAIFYIHFFLVCVLLAYFPFSKLMHMGGVFLSPTRNLANNNRARRHVNPWDYPVDVHTYEHWEEEFKDKLEMAEIPLDKG